MSEPGADVKNGNWNKSVESHYKFEDECFTIKIIQ